MNELQKLMVTADSFANTSHSIFRCPGVLKCYYMFDVSIESEKSRDSNE